MFRPFGRSDRFYYVNFYFKEDFILMKFEMIGRLSMPKATEKFEPFVKKKYESGWIRKQLMFNMTCGDNRHMLSVTSGAFDDEHGDVYTYSKATVDENGNKVKGESLKIPFKDRLTSPKLAEVQNIRSLLLTLKSQVVDIN